jgi:hypothetical protein
MHVTVRRYQEVRGGLDDALRRHFTDGFIPIIQKASGFIAYYALDPGDGGLVTISVFGNAAEAEESTRMAADYIRENLADRFSAQPEVTSGEVVAHAGS